MERGNTNLGRRRLLIAGLVSAAGAATYFAIKKWQKPDTSAAKSTTFKNRLRIPGRSTLLGEASDSIAQPITLQTGVFALPLREGTATDVWGYGQKLADGSVQVNPTLFARTGQALNVTLHNRLGDDTTIHWHGFSVDELNDGGGLHPVRHGEQFTYAFPVRNRSGLYWYHAHPHSQTGRQVHKGLAGLVVVEDDEELQLQKSLGTKWGENDIALLISDKQFGLRNKMEYELAADDWIGNKVLINWTADPFLETGPGWVRLRLANASNARLYRIAFVGEDDEPIAFHLLGTDSGLLNKPLSVSDAFLAPAQRLDVLLDLRKFAPGDTVMMRSLPYDPMENDVTTGMPEDPMMEHPGATPMGEAIDMMLIKVAASKASAAGALPAMLSSFATGISDSASRRPFRLWIQESGRWMLNNWNFHQSHGHNVFDVKRGTTEIWEITNEMRSMPHPMHLHGFQFLVTGRQNSPHAVKHAAIDNRGRTPHDLGLLDTVLVWPGETVSIQIDFSQPYQGEQRYMFHCHNLEHEDQGMMVHFAVVD
jgi:FtsP/CotA-like multicopper oxidase with cupredoxin domain